MKTVFMGTPEFAVPCLKVLINNGYEVAAVVTQPDRAKGRGNKLTPPPVKVAAEQAGIPVYQPEKVKTPEFVGILKALAPDIIVVVAFGQILSQEILDIPPLGCINVHASLLPKYRGAAPINWCIINGDKTTGITIMHMDKGLDTGDMILKKEIPILEDDTAETLHDKLSDLGAEVLLETMMQIGAGGALRVPQAHGLSNYAPIMTKALGKIQWEKSVEAVRDLIRGTAPWPGAYASYLGKSFKVLRAEIADRDAVHKDFGKILAVHKDGFVVACGKGSLKILEVQFENEKRMGVDAYLRGHTIEEGIILE